jgi:membrane protease YdiL (CAAX protease family)
MADKGSKNKKSENGPLTDVFRLWAWILLAWSIYRYFCHFPEAVDEFLVKPLIFVVPIIWYVVKKEKRPLSSIGLTGNNFFISLYTGFGIGFLFALEGMAANFIKYGQFTINPIAAFRQYGFFLLLLSIATAFSEELFGRGFIFSRFYEKSNENLLYASFYSAGMTVLLHVPILLTSLKFQGPTLILYFITSIAIALANAVLYRQTKSLVGPVLVHLFWNMTVALYL